MTGPGRHDGCAESPPSTRPAPSTPRATSSSTATAITAVGAGPAPAELAGATCIDGTGCLATPGPGQHPPPPLPVATRGLAQSTQPVRLAHRAVPGLGRARRRLGARRRRGGPGLAGADRLHDQPPTTTTSSRAAAATCSGRRSRRPRGGRAAASTPAAGSMDLGESRRRAAAGRRRRGPATRSWPPPRRRSTGYHDPSPARCCAIAVAPCSPFSVTAELMREAAELARAQGRPAAHPPRRDRRRGASSAATLRLHPGSSTLEELGWLGAGRVARARRPPVDDAAIARLGATGTGVAHCPTSNARLGAGIARVRDLLDAGRRRSASASTARPPTRPARLVDGAARRRCCAPGCAAARQALTAREALALATIGGARVPGPGRPRSARWSRASSPTSRCGASTASATPASRTRSPRSSSAPPPARAAAGRRRRWSPTTTLRRRRRGALARDRARRASRTAAPEAGR